MRTGSKLAIVAVGSLLFACKTVNPGTDRWTQPGPHPTIVEELGPDGAYVVVRPDDLSSDQVVPVVVFSVGTGGSPGSYESLLRHWASHGFVVVAGDSGMQQNGDQALAALAWLLDQGDTEGNPLSGHIDHEHIAAVGHSQGGNACLHVALRDPRVTTVLPIMPGEGVLGNAEEADESRLTVPVFYVCGQDDGIVPASHCQQRYDDTPANAWKGVIRDAGHFAPVGHDAGEDQIDLRRYTTMWLYAQLLDDPVARQGFFGADWSLATDPGWTDVERKAE